MAGLLRIAVIIVFSGGLFAQNLREERFVERAQTGFTEIFNMDYERARQSFIHLARDYRSHPAPPLYLASILWLEEMVRRQDLSLNRFIAPGYFTAKTDLAMSSADRSSFFNYIQESQRLAEAILRKNPTDPDARYFLAMAYGLRASFAITIDHSLTEAFRNGNRAYAALKKLTSEKPDYYDAYLTVGIYEYIVGNIPWYLKWMAYLIGARGGKEDGIRYLRLASEKGQYVRNEAELVCMVLYVREHRFAEALEIAQSLHGRYPRNFLFPINIAQIMRMAGLREQAAAMLLEVERRADAKEPNYHQLPLPGFRFDVAVELMSLGQLDTAEERFRKLISDPAASTRIRALSHLRLGQLLEWKHRPAEADREYRTVLSMQEFEGSHAKARAYLRKRGSP